MDASPTPRHVRRATLALLACALIAAGCGSKDESDTGPKETKQSGSARADMPTEVTKPTPDADLTKELGADGAALTAAGCTFGTFTQEEAEHVDDVSDLTYATFPPTSGTHFQDWAPFGAYDAQVPDGYATHDLEHGGVVVWFGTEVDDAMRGAVNDLLDDGEKWLTSPRDDLDGLYSAAWGKGLWCPPAALAKLDASTLADALDTWFQAVESTGSDAEKDVPAYAGSMKEPTPERDISTDPPF